MRGERGTGTRLNGRDGAASGRSPRAFAQGCGVLFQTAGLLLALSTCCVGSFIGLIQKPNRAALASGPAETVIGAWSAFRIDEKLGAIGVAANCVAGLALAAAGLGLQYDRAGSARLAVLAALPLAAFEWLHVGVLAWGGPRTAWMAAPALLGLVWSALGALALISAGQHREHPPPRGLDRVPPDYNLPATAGERMYREWLSRRGGPDGG